MNQGKGKIRKQTSLRRRFALLGSNSSSGSCMYGPVDGARQGPKPIMWFRWFMRSSLQPSGGRYHYPHEEAESW